MKLLATHLFSSQLGKGARETEVKVFFLNPRTSAFCLLNHRTSFCFTLTRSFSLQDFTVTYFLLVATLKFPSYDDATERVQIALIFYFLFANCNFKQVYHIRKFAIYILQLKPSFFSRSKVLCQHLKGNVLNAWIWNQPPGYSRTVWTCIVLLPQVSKNDDRKLSFLK